MSLITTALTYSRESVNEYFIKPLFLGEDITKEQTVHLDVKSSKKLNLIDKLNKITKAYAQGTSFTPSTGVTITQKTLTTGRMKAEVRQAGREFYNMVMQEALKSGVNQNDIGGTVFEEIVFKLFYDALYADIQRQIWFNDTTKTTVSSDIATATADTNYNVYQGHWARIFTDVAATTIAASQYVDLNSTTYLTTAGVKQVTTTTLTGTSGTGNITFNGTAYLATFDTDLTTTAANFVTAHGATIAARYGGAVVTSSGAGVIFTANIAGVPFSASACVNASGNLAGNAVATTANVDMSTPKADGALAAFKAMYAAMTPVLKARKSECKIYATSSLVDNYRTTLESATAGSEAAYYAVINGVKTLAYRGIPIVEKPDWDVYINEDFGDQRPNRALLTIPANLHIGTDAMSDYLMAETWYDKPTQENVFRVEYDMGTQYLHPDYIVAAY